MVDSYFDGEQEKLKHKTLACRTLIDHLLAMIVVVVVVVAYRHVLDGQNHQHQPSIA